MRNEYSVQTQALCMAYRGKAALNQVDIAIQPGTVVGILGANGSGKTTLLKIAAGMLQGYTGRIAICGQTDTWKSKHNVCLLSSNPWHNPGWTIARTAQLFEGLYPGYNTAGALQQLPALGLSQGDVLGRLSRGKRALALFVLTLARDARVYLLDEPFSGIDIKTRHLMRELLIDMMTPQRTFLIATHELVDMETLLDEVIVFAQGRVVLQGQTDVLRAQHGKPLEQIIREVL